jgi:predicted RNA binding protein YcfA (HicA-like mRNA interferase family)
LPFESSQRQEILQAPRSQGWELKRINCSHHIYAKAGENARISVPVHGNTPLKTGLQRHLMKVAGIEESEL